MKQDALTRDLLAWLSESPRTYAHVMEVWRSTCPRLSIWEDALSDGLVRIERDEAGGEARVVVTARGENMLDARTA